SAVHRYSRAVPRREDRAQWLLHRRKVDRRRGGTAARGAPRLALVVPIVGNTMLKLGICTLDQLLRVNPERIAETRGRFKKFCNVELYEDVASLRRDGVRDLQESILDLFPTANGTFKRTSTSRFDSFDDVAVDVIAMQMRDCPYCVVHDI